MREDDDDDETRFHSRHSADGGGGAADLQSVFGRDEGREGERIKRRARKKSN
jgi:hypothetical protein